MGGLGKRFIFRYIWTRRGQSEAAEGVATASLGLLRRSLALALEQTHEDPHRALSAFYEA